MGTHLVEVAVGEHLDRVPDLDAGAVDQYPDRVAVSQDLGYELRDVVWRGQVGCVYGGFATEGLDSFLGLIRSRIPLVQNEVSAK